MSAPDTARCPHCFGATTATPCPHCGWQLGQDNPPPALALGRVLDGRYRIGRVLGHGGFGITYLAWDDNLQLRLAIKEYLPRDCVSRGPDGVSLSVYSGQAGDQFTYGLHRFLEEARTLAHFDQHPGIVTVKNFFRAHGTGYCVMDYVEGITLRQYLDQQPGGRISVAAALKLLMPVADALRAVHKEGLLHRDLAPDNIYLTQDGRIKLLDFGAARFAASEHSKSLSIILKPGYAPEEQYRTKGKQGPWTDVYGLAATLYRAITGQVPPESLDRMDDDDLVPPSRLGIAITPGQEATLLQALAVKAGERFQGMAELQEAWRSGARQPLPAGKPRAAARTEEAVTPATTPVTQPKAGFFHSIRSELLKSVWPTFMLFGLLLIFAKIAPHSSPETTQPLPTLAEGESYRYVGTDQDIVEDTRTQLQWQRCSLGQTWNGATCTGKAVSYKWDEVQRVAPEGWRLPTKGELASLVYCSSGEPAYWKTASEKCKGDFGSPTIRMAAFPDTPQAWFWSISTNASNSYYAWYVNFYDGSVDNDNKSYVGYVRLVRGGIPTSNQVTPTSVTPTSPPVQTTIPPPPQGPAAPEAKAPLYFAAALAPTSDIPPEAPLCYKYMVAGPEEQLRKLKSKYPGLYDDRISANPEGGKNLVAKRKDETGKEIPYFYSTSPKVCNDYQKDRLQTPSKPGDRDWSNTAAPQGGASGPTGKPTLPTAGAPTPQPAPAATLPQTTPTAPISTAQPSRPPVPENRAAKVAEGERAYKQGDYELARKILSPLAEAGDPQAQFYLGRMYDNGQGVAKNEAEALRWFRKAAEQGHAKGQFNLGVSYETGQGFPQDAVEAARWVRKAAKQGLANAQSKLGYMYQYGRGVAKDEAEAVRWFRKAAEQGYAEGQFNLGVSYLKGQGVAQDKAEAVRLFRKAAAQGVAEAQAALKALGAQRQ